MGSRFKGAGLVASLDGARPRSLFAEQIEERSAGEVRELRHGPEHPTARASGASAVLPACCPPAPPRGHKRARSDPDLPGIQQDRATGGVLGEEVDLQVLMENALEG